RRIDVEDRRHSGESLVRAVFSPRSVVLPFQVIAGQRALRWLSVAAFCFAWVQGCVFSFYVTYLNTDLGLSLTAAGTAFAVLQGVGMVARITMGFIADWLRSAVLTLSLLALGSCLSALLVAGLSLDPPWVLVLVASGIIGFAGVSWNGVFLA